MLSLAVAMLLVAGEDQNMLKFDKERLGDVTYEAASVCDINNDGILDIVTGEYWYEGPDFTKRHKMCSVRAEGDYYDDFADYPLDVNGDGFVDIVTGGWWNESLLWRENPKGQDVEWQVHEIAKIGSVERPCFYDLDNDGIVEVVPNTPGQPVHIYKLLRDAAGKGAGKFQEAIISEGAQGHGIGCGDINGDGRPDIVLNKGWLEAPADPFAEKWVWHPEFDLGGSSSTPILVYDVNGDGVNDIIVGMGHDYGLLWFEQKKDAQGNRTWEKHVIDAERSQYHDLQLVDIDNDGQLELITGKRYWAHCGNDPGERDPIGLYYFKMKAGQFERVTIDYGTPDKASGTGIYFWVADLDGNGWKDIVAPGKEGVYIFRNRGHQ